MNAGSVLFIADRPSCNAHETRSVLPVHNNYGYILTKEGEGVNKIFIRGKLKFTSLHNVRKSGLEAVKFRRILIGWKRRAADVTRQRFATEVTGRADDRNAETEDADRAFHGESRRCCESKGDKMNGKRDFGS